jgi:hypothetical protein
MELFLEFASVNLVCLEGSSILAQDELYHKQIKFVLGTADKTSTSVVPFYQT